MGDHVLDPMLRNVLIDVLQDSNASAATVATMTEPVKIADPVFAAAFGAAMVSRYNIEDGMFELDHVFPKEHGCYIVPHPKYQVPAKGASAGVRGAELSTTVQGEEIVVQLP